MNPLKHAQIIAKYVCFRRFVTNFVTKIMPINP
nr:MAG TPA: envelope glycoprotein [Bacteriophage sp.]